MKDDNEKRQKAIDDETGCFHCGKRFVDAPYLQLIKDNERKFFNIEHFQAYLKKMKDDAEKTSEIFRTVPEAYKNWVAYRMLADDIKKKKSSISAIWCNFIVPKIGHYHKIILKMGEDYDEKCPCCLKPNLVFLSDSGNWKASKDRMKRGLPYGHIVSIVLQQKLKVISLSYLLDNLSPRGRLIGHFPIH